MHFKLEVTDQKTMKTLKMHYLSKHRATATTCPLIMFQLKKSLFFQTTTLQ